MHANLGPTALAELRRPRTYPAVSVLAPTHRREPDNAQGALVLRNLLAEAKDRIQADPAVSRADRIDVLGQLEQAFAEVDLVHAEDGLVLFAAPGEHRVYPLARTVPARVVLAETFLTRNLVSAQAAEQPYWVVTVSADRITLWSGGVERVERSDAGEFPLARSLEDPDAERQERIGDLPSTFRDEQTRQFLRQARTALGAVLAADPRPLYVVGESAALALFDETGPAAVESAAHVVHGGLGQGPAEAVWQVVQPALEARAEQGVADVLDELDKAKGRQEFAAGVDEVWQHAAAGRVGLLVVEEHYQVTVRDEGDHLVPAEPGSEGSRDDVVDDIVERALDTGARVRFVPDGTLTDQGRLAAALRY